MGGIHRPRIAKLASVTLFVSTLLVPVAVAVDEPLVAMASESSLDSEELAALRRELLDQFREVELAMSSSIGAVQEEAVACSDEG